MRPGHETSTHYFSYSDGSGAVFRKSASGDSASNLCFLHSVRSVGHEVHSGVSGVRNVDALFFTPGRSRCSFQKKHIGTRYIVVVFLRPVGSACPPVHFGASEV
jgi:hypothetical protein